MVSVGEDEHDGPACHSCGHQIKLQVNTLQFNMTPRPSDEMFNKQTNEQVKAHHNWPDSAALVHCGPQHNRTHSQIGHKFTLELDVLNCNFSCCSSIQLSKLSNKNPVNSQISVHSIRLYSIRSAAQRTQPTSEADTLETYCLRHRGRRRCCCC